jgi:hypothetical protein
MAGGAGNVGGSGGMGQQPMGNASAQPQMGGQGGMPSYAQPYMNNFGSQNQGGFTPQTQGGSFSQAFGGGSQGNNPFGMQQPQPYGMQQPQPYGMQPMQNPFGGLQMALLGSPSYGGFQQQQQMGAPNQMAQPMPQQQQQPSYQSNPDYQAYQTQAQDLSRQMDDYVKKAPMYQQLQDLQGKMRGFQQPQGQMGDTGFNRAMPAVMPQQPDPGMIDEMGLFTPETYGNQRIDNRMGMPDYGRGGGYGGGYGGRGGYGQQMPQPDYGYGQMQNQMRQQAAFGQQQRQQYGGLDALQQYLRPPSYRPPVVAPLPLNQNLTVPKPALPPPSASAPVYDPGGPSNGIF